VSQFIALSDALTFTFSLKRGEGYLINNGWMLHGRTSFSGHRSAHRIMVSPHEDFRMGMSPVDLGFSVV
jgi:alpha-ketoglutarate-dependent taurine dioxygenase